MSGNKSGFKRFEFFEVDSAVISSSLSTQSQAQSRGGYTLNCGAAESGTIALGDNNGNIIIADSRLFSGDNNGSNVQSSSDRIYKAFRGEVIGIGIILDSNHKFFITPRHYLLAIGEEIITTSDSEKSSQKQYCIKIFQLSDCSRPIGILNATIAGTAGANSAQSVSVTAFAVMQDCSQIAVGYSTGAIVLYQVNNGNYGRERDHAFNNAFSTVVLLPSHASAVTSLHFAELPIQPQTTATPSSHRRLIRLFVTFAASTRDSDASVSTQKAAEESSGSPYGSEVDQAGILVFDTSTLNGIVNINSSSVKVLDERGALSHCSTFIKATCELVIARSEAVYNYSVDDRGAAMAVSGDKICVCAAGRYTLIASIDDKSAATSAEIAGGLQKPRRPVINIFDLKNKIICGTAKKYQLAMNEKILFSLSDGSTSGTVYIVTSPSFSVIRFKEKDTRRKLDVLLTAAKPPLYSLAILLAAEEQLDPVEIMSLYKMYGDHFYEIGEFHSAIIQYCNTIGYVAPSYVVMKYLDPHRISNLITYLEKLHEKGLAAKEHVNLLLACYTKIKDDPKISSILSAFLGAAPPPAHLTPKVKLEKFTPVASLVDGNTTVTATESKIFDAKQVIITLSNAGYIEQALLVALKYHDHLSYIDLQLSKTPIQTHDALAYMAYLAFVDPYPSMLDTAVRRYGRLLLRWQPRGFTSLLLRLCNGEYQSLLAPSSAPSTTATANVTVLAGLISADVSVESSASSSVSGGLVFPKAPLSLVDYIYLYTDHQEHLLTLLTGGAEYLKSSGRPLPSKLVNTLLELYLNRYQRDFESIKVLKANPSTAEVTLRDLEKSLQATEAYILNTLDGPYSRLQYDPSHVMLLTNAAGFTAGQKFLLEKQQQYKSQSVDLLLRISMERDDVAEIFKLLRREGGKDPELYVQALTYLVKRVSADAIALAAVPPPDRKAGQMKRERDSDDELSSVSEGEEDDDDDDGSDDGRWDDVIEAVGIVQNENVLSTSQVIAILSSNPHLPLRIVSELIERRLKESTDEIASLEESIASSMSNLESQAIKRLEQGQTTGDGLAKAIIASVAERRINSSKNLEFGEEYDDEEDEEDAEYARLAEEKEQEKWNSIRRSQLECSRDHELFYKELELSKADGFTTVASFFGRSIIS